uniref:C2H2-type domain-containing protein n=1 Tax=Stomoxys calcitrans TaxID=35570 RepID=A0A1I8Q4F7_STOCA
MINTLLEHVPIKMEDVIEAAGNNNAGNGTDEHVKDDDEIDSEDEDDDEDLEEDDEESDSEVFEVEQEVTMLMSSDEEAELEAQRIRFPEKRAARKKSQDSKTSRTASRNSISSQSSSSNSTATASSKTSPNKLNGEINETKNNKQQQLPANEKETTKSGDSVTANTPTPQTQQQRTSPRTNNKKENNPPDTTTTSGDGSAGVGDLRQVVNCRRQSNNSTCSVGSSIASSESAETESCGNIYVFQRQQKLIFSCEFCDLKYETLENLSRHLHETHHLFQTQDEDQEKENSPRNLRNKNRAFNHLPTKALQQQTLRAVKKEPLQTTAETTLPPVALSLDTQSEHSLESCGNVFVLNHRKLFLICGHCETKYANVELFEKHLRQQHDVFDGTKACNEVNVVPKTEIKEEVFIITEVVERAAVTPATEAAMVTIPAEIPLNISTNEIEEETTQGSEEVIVPHEIPMESEVISSIQIHDSGVTVAEIPVLITTEEAGPIQQIAAESLTSSMPSIAVGDTVKETIIVQEIEVEQRPPSPPKEQRKRRSSTECRENKKSPQKRPRRNTRKTTESPTDKKESENSTQKRKSPVAIKDIEKSDEKEGPPAVTETTKETETIPEANVKEKTKNSSKKKATTATKVPKRKRKPVAKTKIEKPETVPLTTPSLPPTFTKPEINMSGLSDRDEEFLEDPVAEIIEQIQNEMNNGAQEVRIENVCSIPTTLSNIFSNSTAQIIGSEVNLSKPQLLNNNGPDSPEDIKPIINHLGERRFACDQCPRSFRKNVRLVEHKRLHTGEKPFVCDECGKSFRIRMQLNEHKLRHSKEKKFICEVCQLGCCTKQDLNLHMRHHTNDRRFHCTMCPKAFVRNSDLKIHVRVHTGEKPYVCDICHKCFRANQNLSVHKKSHMGEASRTYKCEHCDKKFLRNIDRTVHMRSHTGEKPFKCEICNRAYSSKFNVRAHIERDHISENGKKKPGPKPRALKEELAKQKKLIEELQQQLLQQIKTDEKDIPAEEHSNNVSDMEDATVMAGMPITNTSNTNVTTNTTTTTTNEHNESFIISEINSPTSVSLRAMPSPASILLDNPFTKAARQKSSSSSSSPSPPSATATTTTTMVPLTITPNSTTTQVVSQNTSLGIQQVMSVTVSMQVENVPANATPAEKENTGMSNLQLTTTATTPPANNVKKERKITSYFTVVGQKAEA